MSGKPLSYIAWFLKIYLYSIGEGLQQYPTLYYSYALFLVISYIINFLTMIAFAIHTDDRILRIESMALIMAMCLMLLICGIVKSHKKFIEEIIKDLNKRDQDFIRLSNKTFLFLLKVIIVLMLFCEICYVLSPLVMIFQADVRICEPDTFYILSEVPWQCNSTKMYIVTMCYHLIVVIHPIICFYSTSLAIISIYAFSFTNFSQLLTRIGELLPDETGSVVEEGKLDDLLCSRFTDFVKHFQSYNRLVNKITNLLSAVSSAIVICVTITLIWDISIFTEFQTPILKKMRCLSTTVVMLISLSVSCFVGEHTKEANTEIRNAVYNIPWYEQSIKLRRVMIVFMAHTQHSSIIKVYGIYPLNINFSVIVLKNIYSGLNFYLSSYRRT